MGIGASAGGLEALLQLLGALPERTGLAFAVVQHLDPRQPSLLAELLQRRIAMPVREAADGEAPRPDHVHVAPPGMLLSLSAGRFRTSVRERSAASGPIDVFLHSLAADRGPLAVGILLSGGGHDGTAGLRAVREAGGLTLVQSPGSARHGDMPRSAIEAGVADLVLPPEEMALRLVQRGGPPPADARGTTGELDAEVARRLGAICTILRERSGHDFSGYKESTLVRRVVRRLQLLQLDSADEYLRHLGADPAEPQALVQELLIGVTAFFRDPEAFEALARQALPSLAQPPGEPVRVWVPGCASGEEAYSLAILLREHLDQLDTPPAVQVFGTDLDAALVAEARAGCYPASIAARVGPERLERFFHRSGEAWEVHPALREMCVFSQHSLVRDPPFSQIDLLSCRNVLIYLDGEAQRRLFPLFHYSLRPGGILFLGTAEGVTQGLDLFEVVDRSARIFRRRETLRRTELAFPLAGRGQAGASAPAPAPSTSPTPSPRSRPPTAGERLAAAFERLVLEEYAHPCAVVDARGEIALVAGPLSRFLHLPAGAPSTNLLEATRGTLRVELRAALQDAARLGRRVVRERVAAEVEDDLRQLRLVVRPMPGVDPSTALYLVALQPLDSPAGQQQGGHAATPEEPEVQRLEEELRFTRADLRTAAEQAEAAQEELRSSNEELVSTNEELQAANEELQTSREELQSLNEELETVNAELRLKVDELGAAHADLQNLFAGTEIATVFLDGQLGIVRFTPAATEVFHLREGDAGRPLADFAPRLAGADLQALAREALRAAAPVERLMHAVDGERHFIARAVPYRTLENQVAGVVLAFLDVTELRRAEEALRHSEERLRRSQEIAHLGSWELDLERNQLAWSDEVYRIFGLEPQEFGATYQNFLDAVHPEDRAAVDAAYATSVREGRDSYEIVHRVVRRGTGEVRIVHEKCEHQRDAGGRIVRSVGMVHDVTEREQVAAALRGSEHRQAALAEQRQLALDSARMGWWHYDPVTGVSTYDQRYAEIFGVVGRGLPNDEILKLLHPGDLPRVWAAVEGALDPARRLPYAAEYRIRRPDGEERWIEAHGLATFAGEGSGLRATSLVGTVVDVTERKATEVRLAYLASFPEQNPNPIVEVEGGGRVAYANPAAQRLLPDLGERGGHHPWLAGWQEAAAAGSRLVSVGDRLYRQTFFSPTGGVVRAYGMDVTERERALAALERSRRGLSRLAEASLSVMSRNDLEGMLRAIAEAALALCGARLSVCGHGLVGAQFVVGGSARAAGAPACPPGDMFRLERGGVHLALAEGAESIRLTEEQLRAHPRWWGLPEGHVPMRGLLGAAMRSRGGETRGMILVTDREEGEFTEEEESLLRQLATVGSLALQHVEARLSLEAADLHKNQFLAMLSHELRNPLAPIRNSLHLLRDAAPGSEKAGRAQAVIDRQVGHLTSLVDDLLDVTRISSGKIQLRREPLDLVEVVRRAVEDHRPVLASAGLRLELDLPGLPVPVDGDRTRLSQVIGNLLQNAGKFTPSGGRIGVAVERVEPLLQAVVRVTDDGAGIAPETLPRLFQPFFQADTTLDRSRGGLGLGLSLVRGLVQMHGGTATVHSEGPGRGAEFTLRFPLRAAAAQAAPSTAPGRPPRPRRVLIIEDNPDAADTLRDLLEMHGHRVEVARTGAEGVALARAFEPEIVLCDVGLPAVDGYAVARELAADVRLRGAVLVAVTGYAAPDDVARALGAGFHQHLAKPVSLERLQAILSGGGPAEA